MNAVRGEGRGRLEIRDLVLIALLSAAGGVLSTYIGYLGNLVNRMFGVPFGAGQIIAGFHVIWPLLARALVGRFGSGTLTGLTKGAVELFTGGTHGAVIVFISAIEGLFVDVGLSVTRRRSLPTTMLAGALASASNVVVFQAIYFSGVALGFLGTMVGLALVSGAVFGGYLAWDLETLLVRSRVVAAKPSEPRSLSPWRRGAVLLLVGAFLAGAVGFYVLVFDPFSSPGTAEVQGAVEVTDPFFYSEDAWTERTVNAELRGSATYVPPANYTGIPLQAILARASPRDEATRLRVVAFDGYEAEFVLADVLDDPNLLLTFDGEALRLVAPGYDGAYWVRQVVRLVVE
ncbi:MAG: ECF transporter S component [Candidatus Bipolaricaulota bacterium]